MGQPDSKALFGPITVNDSRDCENSSAIVPHSMFGATSTPAHRMAESVPPRMDWRSKTLLGARSGRVVIAR